MTSAHRCKAAIAAAEEVAAMDCPAARWIASDALRELRAREVAGGE
jgi:hypothetical protein